MDVELREAERQLALAPRDPSALRAYLAALTRGDPLCAALRLARAILTGDPGQDAPVLLIGEQGTAKEKIARALHGTSPRAAGPFVVFDARGNSSTFLHGALFGFVGRMLGAQYDEPGCLRGAHRGVAFIEIATVSEFVSRELVRLIDSKEVRQVNASDSHRVDSRLVLSTTRAGADTLPAELLERIPTRVELPPLRERLHDLLLLLTHAQPAPQLDPSALEALEQYDWPGNDDELYAEARLLAERYGSSSVARNSLPSKVVTRGLEATRRPGGIYRIGPPASGTEGSR